MARHNYFFALLPDAAASDQIDRLTRRLLAERPGLGRPMARRRRHVSLAGLAEDAEPLADWTRRAVDAVSRLRAPRFVVAFNRIAAFAGGGDLSALVLRGDEGVLGVDLLRAAIGETLAGAGLAPRRRRAFEAHLTLVRGRDRPDETFIAPIGWTVREFVLIHSFVGETRYEIAARFPLADGGGGPTI